MVGPPPPPPPPPPPAATVSPGRWKTEIPSRPAVANTAKPAPGIQQRPSVDASSLQHAAARLRKTEYGESLRSDQPSVPDGRVDGSDQSPLGRHRQNCTQFRQLDIDQTRESIPAATSHSDNSSSLRNVRRCADSINEVVDTPSSFPSGTPVCSTPPTNNFARELRDGGLTERQRKANEQKDSRSRGLVDVDVDRVILSSDPSKEISQLVTRLKMTDKTPCPLTPSYPPPSIPPPLPPTSTIPSINSHSTFTSSSSSSSRSYHPLPPSSFPSTHSAPPPISQSKSLLHNVCANCKEEITGDKPGCTALNQVYHVACFVCDKCGDQLAGSSFYNVDGKAICEKDYVDSLEKCAKCKQAISDRLLRAVGGAFHVHCFTCTACNIALDGIPFTVSSDENVYCVPCFHEAFAPRCAVCSKPIIPQDGEKESVRVVAMDKSFHVECYRCEDCGLQLSSKIEGQGCYPLDSHLYCKTCNGNRLRLLASA